MTGVESVADEKVRCLAVGGLVESMDDVFPVLVAFEEAPRLVFQRNPSARGDVRTALLPA